MSTDAAEPKPRRKWHLTKALILLIVATFAYPAWNAYAFRSAVKEAKVLGWIVIYNEPFEMIRKNWKAAFKKEFWSSRRLVVGIPTNEQFEQHLDIVERLKPTALFIDNASTLRDLSAFESLTRLESLVIVSGTSLTNVHGIKNLTGLKFVRLEDCTALTNVDVLKNFPALEKVHVAGCTRLTNVDALQNLSALTHVYLKDCTALTNVDGLKGLRFLKELNLEGCTSLTNVEALNNLTALQIVKLNGCTGLTKERIAALKAALPRTIIRFSQPPPAPKPSQP